MMKSDHVSGVPLQVDAMINGRRRDHGAERAHLEVCYLCQIIFFLYTRYVLFCVDTCKFLVRVQDVVISPFFDLHVEWCVYMYGCSYMSNPTILRRHLEFF